MGYCIQRTDSCSGESSSKLIIEGAETAQEAHALAVDEWGDIPLRIYEFTDVFDTSTYQLILEVE